MFHQVHRLHANSQDHSDLKGIYPPQLVLPFTLMIDFKLESCILQGKVGSGNGKLGCPSNVLRMFCPWNVLKKIEALNRSADLTSVLTHIPIGKQDPFEGGLPVNQTFPVGLFPNSNGGHRTDPCHHHSLSIVVQVHPPYIFDFFIFIDSSPFVKKLLGDFWKSPEISDDTDY
jgi:hypothetical protein